MADFDANSLAGTVFNIGAMGLTFGMMAGLGRNMMKMTDRMTEPNYWGNKPNQKKQKDYRSVVYEPRRYPSMTLKIPKGMSSVSIPRTRLRSMYRPIRW